MNRNNYTALYSYDAAGTKHKTTYRPSGMPFTWRGEQHVTEQLMNGHEYIPMHGYDMYDFGFRHYYATIGRFTSPDPMSEQTPWQSPYVYASNNFTGEIDWMGLETCNMVVTNKNGKILKVDLDHVDKGVYKVDEDDWDGTYWDLLRFEVIGCQIDGYIYNVGDYIGGGIDRAGGGYYNSIVGRWVQYGTIPIENADFIDLIASFCQSDLFESNLALITRLAENSGINYEYVKYLKNFSMALTIAESYNLYKRVQSKGWTLENKYDAFSLLLSMAASNNPQILIGLISLEGCKILGEGVYDIYNSINQYDTYETYINMYNGYIF